MNTQRRKKNFARSFGVSWPTTPKPKSVPIVQPLRSVHHGDRSVPDVPIVQPLRYVQCLAAVQEPALSMSKGSIVKSSREDKPERELARFDNSQNVKITMSADFARCVH